MPKGVYTRTEYHKKIISDGQKGKKLSEEHRKKISEMKKGENSSGWKGGITPENKKIRMSIDFRLWRESVFARDNWVCQKCKEKGIYLHPHHIQNFAQYPELRFDVNNGTTLCKYCHKEFHKTYSRKNNNQEQLNEFLWIEKKF